MDSETPTQLKEYADSILIVLMFMFMLIAVVYKISLRENKIHNDPHPQYRRMVGRYKKSALFKKKREPWATADPTLRGSETFLLNIR